MIDDLRSSRRNLKPISRSSRSPGFVGWRLHLKVTRAPAHLRPELRPLVIIPGYGMNAFIFGFHPRGTSMERCLAEGGFEVWSVDLRGQGQSRATMRQPGRASLQSYAYYDLKAAVDHVLEHSDTGADSVTMINPKKKMLHAKVLRAS